MCDIYTTKKVSFYWFLRHFNF